MIQELEISECDSLVVYFKKLFESYNSFQYGRHSSVKIQTKKKRTEYFTPMIVDKDLPIFITQIKDIMRKYNFESDNDAIVSMQYGITDDIIRCTNEIRNYDSYDKKVNVCVLYLDSTCDGGDLVFYNKPYADTFESYKLIKVTSCKIVMFEGSIYHKRTDYSKGHRLAVVFRFTRRNCTYAC